MGINSIALPALLRGKGGSRGKEARKSKRTLVPWLPEKSLEKKSRQLEIGGTQGSSKVLQI